MMRFTRWQWLEVIAFVVIYVWLDNVSYIEPLFKLNITPWDPSPALGLVYWLKYGKSIAPAWLIALIASEAITRGLPEGLPLTVLLSSSLVIGYGLIGEL